MCQALDTHFYLKQRAENPDGTGKVICLPPEPRETSTEVAKLWANIG